MLTYEKCFQNYPTGKLGCSRIVRVVLHLPLGVAGFVLAGAMVKPACGSSISGLCSSWTSLSVSRASLTLAGLSDFGRVVGLSCLPLDAESPVQTSCRHVILGQPAVRPWGLTPAVFASQVPRRSSPSAERPAVLRTGGGTPHRPALCRRPLVAPSSTPFQLLTPVSTLRPNCLRRTLTNNPIKEERI